jgi:hypothetical protein
MASGSKAASGIKVVNVTQANMSMKDTGIASRSTILRTQISDNFSGSDFGAALESRYGLPVRTYPAAEWKRLKRAGKAIDTIKR